MPLRYELEQTLKDIRRLGPSFALRPFKELFGSRPYSVSVRGAGRFSLRKASSDIRVLRQVFRDREYDLSDFRQSATVNLCYRAILDRGDTPLIIDAGANNGVSARWFAQQFPRAAIAAIEPDAGNCEILRANTYQQPNVTLFRAAIGGSTGEAALKGAGGPAWAIQTERDGTGERVPIVTVTEIAASFGDHHRLLIVKVDIEGFEADLFSRNLEWLDDLPALIIEPHDRLFPGEFTSLPLQRAMASRRFEMLMHGENLVYIRTA